MTEGASNDIIIIIVIKIISFTTWVFNWGILVTLVSTSNIFEIPVTGGDMTVESNDETAVFIYIIRRWKDQVNSFLESRVETVI